MKRKLDTQEFLLNAGYTPEEVRKLVEALDILAANNGQNIEEKANKVTSIMSSLSGTGIARKYAKDIIYILLLSGLYDILKFSFIYASNVFGSAEEPGGAKDNDPHAPWSLVDKIRKEIPEEVALIIEKNSYDIWLEFRSTIKRMVAEEYPDENFELLGNIVCLDLERAIKDEEKS